MKKRRMIERGRTGVTKHLFSAFLVLAFFTFHSSLISSCSSEPNEVYPNVVTDLADLQTDASGSLSCLVLDDGTTYTLSNPKAGYRADITYRVLAGYIPAGKTAQLYSLTSAYILRDSTLQTKTDPTKVLSVWRTSRYLNLHLAPLTQGGKQYWGIRTDSIVTEKSDSGSMAASQPTLHAYLTLHHNQNADPTSYTTDVYASIPLDSILYCDADGRKKSIPYRTPITLRINTFDGLKTWDK